MANTNTPSFAKIGFVVLIGVLALVATLICLGGLRGSTDLVYAETYFENSVSGLSVGSPVNFRGVKLGEVCEITFVGTHYRVGGVTNQTVMVRMSFPRQVMSGYEQVDEYAGLSEDQAFLAFVRNLSLRATVTASGITGLSRIELNALPNVSAMPVSWTPRTVYIPPAPSLLDSFSDAATRVMNQINKMDITAVWHDVAASVQAVAKTMESAQTMMEARHGDVDRILGDVSAITASLRELVEDLKANPSLLVRERLPDPLPETRR